MSSREHLRKQWRILQVSIIGAAVVAIVVGCIGGLLSGLAVWIVEVAYLTILMWRLRCWNCSGRLLSNAGAEIEWEKVGPMDWRPCRHKTCGATLL